MLAQVEVAPRAGPGRCVVAAASRARASVSSTVSSAASAAASQPLLGLLDRRAVGAARARPGRRPRSRAACGRAGGRDAARRARCSCRRPARRARRTSACQAGEPRVRSSLRARCSRGSQDSATARSSASAGDGRGQGGRVDVVGRERRAAADAGRGGRRHAASASACWVWAVSTRTAEGRTGAARRWASSDAASVSSSSWDASSSSSSRCAASPRERASASARARSSASLVARPAASVAAVEHRPVPLRAAADGRGRAAPWPSAEGAVVGRGVEVVQRPTPSGSADAGGLLEAVDAPRRPRRGASRHRRPQARAAARPATARPPRTARVRNSRCSTACRSAEVARRNAWNRPWGSIATWVNWVQVIPSRPVTRWPASSSRLVSADPRRRRGAPRRRRGPGPGWCRCRAAWVAPRRGSG